MIAGDGLGAALTPGYSISAQAISELVAVGAAQKPLVDVFLLAFHALAVAFAAGLHMTLRPVGPERIAPALLAGAGLAGIVLTLFFPCDPGCEPFVTARGTLHIFIAVPMGLAVVFAILLFARVFGRRGEWVAFRPYTRLTAWSALGLAVATLVAAETDWVGILERVLTLSYLQWYIVIGTTIAVRAWRGTCLPTG